LNVQPDYFAEAQEPQASLTAAHILIVDDQPANVRLMERLLERAGYHNLRSTTDPRETLSLFTEFRPDLILLDLLMPHLDGVAVMQKLRPHIPATTFLPILVLTADTTPEAKERALSAGAKDFLTKPFDHIEALLRIQNLLETRRLHRELQGLNERLEQKVIQRTRELEDARNETLMRLALAAEHRDDDTGEHIGRVGEISALVAEALQLPAVQIEMIRRAAPLHDVGKIGIPDVILLKPGKFTPEEFEQMKSHSAIGAQILSGSGVPLLQLAEEIAQNHHERWDGSGYPRGLRGEAIPPSARIVAVVDVFDALTHDRPYKEAWTEEDAFAEIQRQSSKHFDPRVVEAFLAIRERLSLEAPTRAI
jgi:putative two-component system response regulator